MLSKSAGLFRPDVATVRINTAVRTKFDAGSGIKSPPSTPRQEPAYPIGACTEIIHVKLDGNKVALPRFTYHGTHLPPEKAFHGLESPDKFDIDLDDQRAVNTVLRHHMLENIPHDEESTGRNLVSTTKDARIATSFALKDPNGIKARADEGYVYTIDMGKVISDGGFPVFDLARSSPYPEQEVGVLFQIPADCIVHAQKVYPDPSSTMYGSIDTVIIPNPANTPRDTGEKR